MNEVASKCVVNRLVMLNRLVDILLVPYQRKLITFASMMSDLHANIADSQIIVWKEMYVYVLPFLISSD